jgi:hypothetical protein
MLLEIIKHINPIIVVPMQINICITRDVNVVVFLIYLVRYLGKGRSCMALSHSANNSSVLVLTYNFLSAESCYIAIRAGIIISISFLGAA